VNQYTHLQPIGITGELCIAGDGLSRGYLNNPELTSEKFDHDLRDYQDTNHRSYRPYMSHRSKKLYKTGDLARWQPDGNIEYLGRLDHQVKIRGYRIELGEIENQISGHEQVKEAVVINRETGHGEKYLCAYLVCKTVAGSPPPIAELKEYLAQKMPDYMIPVFFTRLEQLPLTPNGKIDIKALPVPEIKNQEEYIAPHSPMEKILADIWARVLKVNARQIGVKDDFFKLGGDSLKAAVIIAKIQKAFNIKIPMGALFQNPNLRKLAGYIKKPAPDSEEFKPIPFAEANEYYRLSSSQKQMFLLQQLHRQSTLYNMPVFIRPDQSPGKEELEKVFKKLIQRHESLRTSFEVIAEEPVQRIHEEVEFEIQYYALGSRPYASNIKDFIRPFDLSQAPLLRVGLIKQDNRDFILIVDMHHIISDGISHFILEEEFWALCQGKKLPPIRLQYKDYVRWQTNKTLRSMIEMQETYWLEEFSKDITGLDLPTDNPRPAEKNYAGNTVRRAFPGPETQAIKKIVKETGSTLFMVMFSIFAILLSKLSGQQEIVIGVPVSGRRHPDLGRIIGVFINTLPVRISIPGTQSCREFINHVKEKCLKAFDNQDYPFEDLVEKLSPQREPGRNPLFDVMLNFFNQKEQGEHTRETPGVLAPDLYSHEPGTAKFDLSIDILENRETLYLCFEYSTQLFKPATIERFIAGIKVVVSAVANDMTRPVEHIEIKHGYSEIETNVFDDNLGDF
jgi:acyl carrier protein